MSSDDLTYEQLLERPDELAALRLLAQFDPQSIWSAFNARLHDFGRALMARLYYGRRVAVQEEWLKEVSCRAVENALYYAVCDSLHGKKPCPYYQRYLREQWASLSGLNGVDLHEAVRGISEGVVVGAASYDVKEGAPGLVGDTHALSVEVTMPERSMPWLLVPPERTRLWTRRLQYATPR